MNDVLEKLKQHIESLSPEELAAEFEKITHCGFYNRWVEKFHKLSIDERAKVIDKVMEKYSSDEYHEREYRLRYEPRMPLYDILLKYAEQYGEPVEADEMFLDSRYIIDNAYIISLYVGQGAFIRVEKI